MHIDDFDRVSQLRNHRQRYIELREAARRSYVSEFKIGGINVFGVICVDPVRQAIAAECDKLIADADNSLRRLGVVLEPKTAQTSA